MAKIVGGFYFKERNKSADQLSKKWRSCKGKDLYSAYEKPSENKQKEWEDCKVICKECNGSDLCVVCHSCYFFSASFVIRDPWNGNIPVFVCKITASNLYIAPYIWECEHHED